MVGGVEAAVVVRVWHSYYSTHQSHLRGLWKRLFLGPTLRVPDSDLRICFSNMFSGELIQGPVLSSKDLGYWEVVRLEGGLHV